MVLSVAKQRTVAAPQAGRDIGELAQAVWLDIGGVEIDEVRIR